MNDIEPRTARNLLMAAMAGAAVGAGVALLLAPCSGKETRGWLMDKTRAIKDRTAQALEQGKLAALKVARERLESTEAGATTFRG
jgi:gas vesicle protein